MLGCWTFCVVQKLQTRVSRAAWRWFACSTYTQTLKQELHWTTEGSAHFRAFAAVQVERCSEQEIMLLQIFCLFCICAVFLCKHTTELEVLTLFNQLRALLSFFLLGSSFVYTVIYLISVADPYVITHAVFLIIFTCKASSVTDHLLLSSSIQVSRILYSFSTAFRRSSRPADIRDTTLSGPPDGDLYTFTVTLEIKEDDGKGNYKYMITRAEIHLHFSSLHHRTVRMTDVGKDLMYFIWLFYHLQRA